MSTWNIDTVHSRVGFSVRHLMISTVRGQFKNYSGTFKIDPEDFTKSTFEVEIEVDSIDTNNAQRDGHLRTNDFFDAPNHPKITFKSTSIEEKRGDYLIHGELQIRGVTQAITLETEFHGTSKMGDNLIAGLEARATVNRSEFGVSFNNLLEAGGVAISEKVKIEIDAEFVRS